MSVQALFGISILLSFIAFGLVAAIYIWPRVRVLPTRDALLPLVLPHTFRFIGLSFLVPGVVSSSLPRAFAAPAAYGDLVALLLAMAASLALWRRAALAVLLVWVFNLWGAADLLFAYYQGITSQLDAGLLGAAYFIPTLVVPAALITHGLILGVLVRGRAVGSRR